jgi:hypothetical protein
MRCETSAFKQFIRGPVSLSLKGRKAWLKPGRKKLSPMDRRKTHIHTVVIKYELSSFKNSQKV